MYLLEILIKLGHTVQDLKCTGEEMHLMRLKIETRYTLPPDPPSFTGRKRRVKIVFPSNYLQGGRGGEREGRMGRLRQGDGRDEKQPREKQIRPENKRNWRR